ncbi:ATP-dependent zinc metalloprotease FTSH 12, chloroplastic-like [Pistacia vera]|uniref:ATP-dependent zinc metalloprotease FTSH 12, chloroplastic-like n=1 Tax=Pistacia vera TaxID=55513 RepID=UPI001263CE79|nr:ATP-dependent zinc metalloprotease FTSH 12, chloroplastic-like [Pistacia vera]
MIDQGYTTFGYMKMQMVVAHGGCCAERVVFGEDITDGGKDDIEKITKIAREMVISPQNARLGLAALTKRVGLLDRPDSSDGELIKYRWDDPHVIPANMTPELSELFTRELTRYIEETEELAINALRDNRHILDMIAKELLEKSRITGLEVEEMMKELSPVMFEDFVKPFQINLEEEGPLPHNDQLRYQPLEIYPAPLHRC